jgi:hypothetical protein
MLCNAPKESEQMSRAATFPLGLEIGNREAKVLGVAKTTGYATTRTPLLFTNSNPQSPPRRSGER